MKPLERKQRPDGPLEIFVVYERPNDFPDEFVVRRFELATPTADHATGPTLDEVRALVPQGLHRIARFPEDDPNIVEVWL